jgi:hypothetical protein
MLSLDWRAVAGAIAAILLLLGYGAFRARGERISELEAQAARAAEANLALERALRQERAASFERDARLEGSAGSHEALAEELKEACEYRAGWSVPGALYERLCRPPGGS